MRATFQQYVAALADGVISTDHGAARDSEGRFLFPLSHADSLETSVQAPPPEALGSPTRWVFAGIANFFGHGGLIAVEITYPAIEFAADGHSGVVLLTVPHAPSPGLAVAFGEFDSVKRESGLVRIENLTMTDHAVRLLGDVYELGAFLDPIEVVTDTTPDHPLSRHATRPRQQGRVTPAPRSAVPAQTNTDDHT